MRYLACFVGAALCASVAWLACQSEVPVSGASICGYIEASGVAVAGRAGTDGGICATATNVEGGAATAAALNVDSTGLQFIAVVNAPVGAWQLVMTTQGALAAAASALPRSVATGGPSPSVDGNHDGGVSDAAGAPTVSGEAGAVVEPAIVNFISAGVPIELAVPLSVVGGGIATIQVVVGSSTESFSFLVASAAPPPPSPACIEMAPGTSAQRLAWAVVPPPPPVPDSSAPDAATRVGTVSASIQGQIYDCSLEAGAAPFQGTLSVTGTGVLMPQAATVSASSQGYVVVQLTGPDVSNSATAVLTTPGGGFVTLTVPAPPGG